MVKKNEPTETRRLREFHLLGKRILKAYRASKPLAGGKRRRGVAQVFNEKLGLRRDQVDKARQFAAMYSDEEVEELCNLGSGIGGTRVNKSHVIRLLAVRNRRERHRLAKQVVREQWTVQRLGIEITKTGKTSRGGRRPRRLATVEQALEQIQRMTQQWQRWSPKRKPGTTAEGITSRDLPSSVKSLVLRMVRLGESLETELERIRK